MDEDDGQQIGYKILPRGTPVVTSDGVQIGTVARVQDNLREHIFDGLVVKTPEGPVFVDAPEVARITDKRVTLTIDATAAAALPEHRGWRGSLETRAQRRVARWKRRLGR
jgi:sporulation protein YlmC with PRC-barrel domain